MTQKLILRHGDCVEVLKGYEDGSIGAFVCDPPYDLTAVSRGGSARQFVDNPYGRSRVGTDRKGFMGKTWDGTGIAFSADFWDEVYRVLADVADSLAEKLLRADGGPPAVVASSEVSHPYPNAVLLKEFGWLAAKHRERTVGRLFQQAKVRLIEHKGYCRELIDKYGRLVISDEEIEAQKRTHLHMYTLFGDPTTKMAYVAGRVWIDLPKQEVKPGAKATLAVWRDKARKEVVVKVGELEDERVASVDDAAGPEGGKLLDIAQPVLPWAGQVHA